MLGFEVKRPRPGERPEELEVFLDAAGLEDLLAQLRFLQNGRTDHVHLMSASWGGVDLDDRPQNAGSSSIHHVKIYLR